MKKIEKKERKFLKAGVELGVAIGVMCIVGMLMIAGLNVIKEQPIETEMWQKVYVWTPLGAEGNPGTGASGFLEFFMVNLSDATGYDENSSSTLETWSAANMAGKTPYGNADEFDFEFTSETTCVFMVRVRFNKTHAWETDKFNGNDTDVQLTLTCDNWATGSNINNVSGSRHETRNDTSEDYIWENFVWDNGGTGFQMADDSTVTVTEIYIEARY